MNNYDISTNLQVRSTKVENKYGVFYKTDIISTLSSDHGEVLATGMGRRYHTSMAIALQSLADQHRKAARNEPIT